MQSLLDDCRITVVEAATAAGTGDTVVSAGVDMQDYGGVLFFTSFGAITATAVTTWKVQQSDDDGVGDAYSDLAGTGISVADNDDGQMFGTQIIHPLKRYVRVAVVRATANAVIGEIYAIRFGKGTRPVTNTVTDTATFESFASPAEGTA